MDWNAMAVVGRIARAHGIRGQVIVNLETDFPDERFKPGATLFAAPGGTITPLRLTSVRFQRGRPVIGLQGVETMNDAEQLAGLELRVPIDALAPLPAGTFYHHDLVGCRVVTESGQDVGIVERVEGTMGGSRLVVDDCRTIDVAGKRVVIDPPEGLLDLNR
jgi:16S rRNA processing protein RimM